MARHHGPKESSSLSARRIPEVGSTAWGLYWAVDSHRDCLLVLQHDSSRRPSHRLPALTGLQVETQPAEDGVRKLVIVRLTEGEHRDIFYQLCLDIVESTRLAQSAEEAVDRLVVRTWRWHRLLRGGRDGRLSGEEQKGLIGELLVLERHLLPVIGAADAVRSWVGPLGAAKDFRGRACRRGSQGSRPSGVHTSNLPPRNSLIRPTRHASSSM